MKTASCFRKGTYAWVLDMNCSQIKEMEQTLSAMRSGPHGSDEHLLRDEARQTLRRLSNLMSDEVRRQSKLHPEDMA